MEVCFTSRDLQYFDFLNFPGCEESRPAWLSKSTPSYTSLYRNTWLRSARVYILNYSITQRHFGHPNDGDRERSAYLLGSRGTVHRDTSRNSHGLARDTEFTVPTCIPAFCSLVYLIDGCAPPRGETPRRPILQTCQRKKRGCHRYTKRGALSQRVT